MRYPKIHFIHLKTNSHSSLQTIISLSSSLQRHPLTVCYSFGEHSMQKMATTTYPGDLPVVCMKPLIRSNRVIILGRLFHFAIEDHCHKTHQSGCRKNLYSLPVIYVAFSMNK